MAVADVDGAPSPELDTATDATDAADGRGGPAPWYQGFWWPLALIALGALVLRVVYVLGTRGDFMFSDSYGYHFRGILFADGHPFRLPAQEMLGAGGHPPDAHVPPGWTIVLGSGTAAGLRTVLQQQLFTAVIGTAAVVMTGIAGRAAFGRVAGLVAAALLAIYPNAWVYERELLSEPLSLVAVATLLWLTYRFLARPGLWPAVAMGAAGGALMLTRSEQALAFALVVVPATLVAGEAPWRRRLAWAGAALLTGAVLVAPWAAYNATRFDEPVPLSTGFGMALRAGNCAPTYEDDDLLGWFSTVGPAGDPEACSILDDQFETDASRVDGQLREAALTYMGDNKRRVPVAAGARVGRTFNVFRPLDQVHREAERGSPVKVVQAGLLAYWLLVPFAVWGLVIARRRRIPIFPMLAFVAIVVVAVALTIGSVRYRAPAEVPLVMCAALGLTRAGELLLARLRGPSAAAPAPEAAP